MPATRQACGKELWKIIIFVDFVFWRRPCPCRASILHLPELQVLRCVLLLRETGRLWENLLITKTTFPSPWFDMHAWWGIVRSNQNCKFGLGDWVSHLVWIKTGAAGIHMIYCGNWWIPPWILCSWQSFICTLSIKFLNILTQLQLSRWCCKSHHRFCAASV